MTQASPPVLLPVPDAPQDLAAGREHAFDITCFEIHFPSMKMATALPRMMKRLPHKRRKKIKARAQKLIAEEMSRRAQRKTNN
jgi:hypothetical protein